MTTRKATTTKKATTKAKMRKFSKTNKELLKRIDVLKAKVSSGEATSNDYKYLANALLKVQDKSASRVYKNVTEVEGELKDAVVGMLALKKGESFPTFAEFCEHLVSVEEFQGNKFYSNYDALNAMGKTRAAQLTNKLANDAKKGAKTVSRGKTATAKA